DDTDAEPGKIHAFVRPLAGVIDGPTKILASLEGGMIGRRQAADRHDAESCGDPIATIGFDPPAICSLVKSGARHTRVEHNIPGKIGAVGGVVGVTQNLGLRRVFFRPVPLLVEFLRERERILRALDVAACARIPVPVPRATYAAAGFEDARRKAETA